MALTSLATSTSLSSSVPYAPLTTAFVYPPDCQTFWYTSSEISTSTNASTIYEITKLTLHYVDAIYHNKTSCQPPSWSIDATSTTKLFYYSPAVCPQSWTAYQIATSHPYAQLTTGCCCRSGYTITSTQGQWAIDTMCFRVGAAQALGVSTSAPRMDSGVHQFIYMTAGIVTQYHTPFHISWEKKDVASLTPAPPVPNCTPFTISSWDPANPNAAISCPNAVPTRSDPPAPSDGLSTQSKVTIAVTVGALGFMVMAALLFFRLNLSPRTDVELQPLGRGRTLVTRPGVERRSSTENQDGDDELPKYADALRTAPVDPELQPPMYATPRPGTPNPEHSPERTTASNNELEQREAVPSNTTRRGDGQV
ncbi:hypothetical protein VHEMI07986 [[Torrubiella] hemipterigena]|uniref:Uncharacterized protein n=1 Tax=[Torrubiella] hemipterigena TaxID=1531966 RepID=A0A0A1T587_9HYPO|nr:hypothetical protein VHEMI07986 [[Torrubiella] hemipterigena]